MINVTNGYPYREMADAMSLLHSSEGKWPLYKPEPKKERNNGKLVNGLDTKKKPRRRQNAKASDVANARYQFCGSVARQKALNDGPNTVEWPPTSAPAQPANLDGEHQRHRQQNDDRDHGRAPDRAAAPAEALFVPVYAAH
jgi:hypothetical protein